MQTKPFKFISSLIICFLAAAIGSFFTFSKIETWYAGLHKPFFNPPNWVFGPVWTALYLSMAISCYLVWTKKAKLAIKRTALYLFFGQLVLNTLWSLLFFGLESPVLGLIGIIALWTMILLTIREFLKISQSAAWLLFPYLAWVSFATILNAAIVVLNQ